MAKRKKHRKKKQTQRVASQPNQSVVKQSQVDKTTTEAKQTTAEVATKANIQPKVAEVGSSAETAYVKADVRYSLILIGIIAVVFVVLYLLLQNPTISAKIYGIIKLPNVGN